MSKEIKKSTTEETPAQRGKKAIEAGQKAKGQNPSDKKTKKEEAKDAEEWRNEG